MASPRSLKVYYCRCCCVRGMPAEHRANNGISQTGVLIKCATKNEFSEICGESAAYLRKYAPLQELETPRPGMPAFEDLELGVLYYTPCNFPPTEGWFSLKKPPG